jgi:TMEM175 potassium channel family protein
VAKRRATTERLGAFSDGVFTVGITIMVLELKPPEHPTFAAPPPQRELETIVR